MTRGFRRRRDGRLEATLSADELALLRRVATEMLDLLGDEQDQGEQDPLERMIRIGEASHVPDDPALARLFPDAYSEDPDAAGEFRRYTEDSLRQQKRDAARQILGGLPESSGRVVLGDDEAQAWLRALNDARLALGTRLGVTEEAHEEFARMERDDPRYPGYATYDWLSFLQESLVRAL